MDVSTRVLDYDSDRYPFAAAVSAALGALFPLSDLQEDHDVFRRENDQATSLHRLFYGAWAGSAVELVYRRFTEEWVTEVFGESIVFQRIPTFRAHFRGNVAVGEFHRDRDYGHAWPEVNFWLPLTDAWGSNTVHIESAEGAGDYRPWDVRYGQVLVFDGVNLRHGNVVNDTGATRVSFDFRAAAASEFTDRPAASINSNMRFALGDYFDRHGREEQWLSVGGGAATYRPWWSQA